MCACVCDPYDPCSAPADTLWIESLSRVSQTFSIGIFAACLALTMKCEIVVFRYVHIHDVVRHVSYLTLSVLFAVPPAVLAASFWSAWSRCAALILCAHALAIMLTMLLCTRSSSAYWGTSQLSTTR